MSVKRIEISALSIVEMETLTRRTARLWLLILLGFMLVAAILSWLWTGRAAKEQQQVISRSEAQIVDSRAGAVRDWVANQRRAIDTVATNPTLVPYLSGDGLGDYVSTYLRDTAERDGFTKGLSQVPANVARQDGPGLAIVDLQGRVLIGIGGPLPPADDLIALAKDNNILVDGIATLKGGSALRLLKTLPSKGSERRMIYWHDYHSQVKLLVLRNMR
jgi:hypothetical protein